MRWGRVLATALLGWPCAQRHRSIRQQDQFLVTDIHTHR